jgi:hypothetical protein
LGIKGFDSLRVVLKMVPKSFVHDDVISHSNYQGLTSLTSSLPGPCNYSSDFMKELELLSINTKTALTAFVSPPVNTCIISGCPLQNVPDSLYVHNKAIGVTIFDITGVRPGVKVSLRCKRCSTNYNYNYYGKASAKQLYPGRTELIELSDVSYVTRRLHQWYVGLSVHSWVSFSAFSEAYFHLTNTDHFLKQWCASKQMDVTVTLSRQQVSDMFYLGELEEETINNRCLINDKKEELIKDVVSSIPVYDHIMHVDCKKKGCGKCWSIDGNWKINFPHCMYPVQVSVPALPLINMPDVCINQPLNSEIAFCCHHMEIAKTKGYPTKVRDFVKFCSSTI